MVSKYYTIWVAEMRFIEFVLLQCDRFCQVSRYASPVCSSNSSTTLEMYSDLSDRDSSRTSGNNKFCLAPAEQAELSPHNHICQV